MCTGIRLVFNHKSMGKIKRKIHSILRRYSRIFLRLVSHRQKKKHRKNGFQNHRAKKASTDY